MNSLDVWLDAIAEPAGAWWRGLPEATANAAWNQSIWTAFAVALLVGGIALFLGSGVLRKLRILPSDATSGEIMAVGLSLGLVIIAAASAAVRSLGKSAFTPVAVALLVAIIMPTLGRPRRSQTTKPSTDTARREPAVALIPTASTLGLAGGFILGAIFIYATTVAPLPRANTQPIEFLDEAYYPVLASDLGRTGVETIFSPAGFDQLPGLPVQTWYHWGELWLTADVVSVSGLEPMAAHFYVTLPLILLASASMVGVLVRRLARTRSRWAFASGFAAMLILAPIPLRIDPFFAWWARGFVFGATVYGLAVPIVLLALYLHTHGLRPRSRAGDLFVAATTVAVLPAHIVTAILGVTGLAVVRALDLAGKLRSGVRPRLQPSRTVTAIVALGVIALAYGLMTGHGLGATASSHTVTPFNSTWFASVAMTLLGGGVFLLIPAALLVTRRDSDDVHALFVVAPAAVCAGAIAWGLLLPDFNAFHFFFAAIAVFATPAAVIGFWTLWRVTRRNRPRLALLAALFVTQFGIGTVAGVQRLVQFGPGTYQPIPLAVLQAIRDLPEGARIAYACQPFEEIAFWDPRLISINVHTGHSVVPMCFQAEFLSQMIGGELSPDVPSPFFSAAPQYALFPSAQADPSSHDVAAFLKLHGISYIYSDADHPNTLLEGAMPISRVGGSELAAVP